jgi:hypothetical protein
MKLQNDMALKEWAITCLALEEGKQTLLLKKDGLAEENGVLKPEKPEFFFYPTFDHETPENLKAEWRPRLSKLEKEVKDPKHVHFRLYGSVEGVLKMTDFEAVQRLIPFTVLSDSGVEKLFREGDEPGLCLYVVRVHSLAVPMDLSRKPAYEGCRTWVPLGTSLFTAGAYPVIPDDVWPYTRDKIMKMAQSS